jgi:hypothetical protein
MALGGWEFSAIVGGLNNNIEIQGSVPSTKTNKQAYYNSKQINKKTEALGSDWCVREFFPIHG